MGEEEALLPHSSLIIDSISNASARVSTARSPRIACHCSIIHQEHALHTDGEAWGVNDAGELAFFVDGDRDPKKI